MTANLLDSKSICGVTPYLCPFLNQTGKRSGGRQNVRTPLVLLNISEVALLTLNEVCPYGSRGFCVGVNLVFTLNARIKGSRGREQGGLRI